MSIAFSFPIVIGEDIVPNLVSRDTYFSASGFIWQILTASYGWKKDPDSLFSIDFFI